MSLHVWTRGQQVTNPRFQLEQFQVRPIPTTKIRFEGRSLSD